MKHQESENYWISLSDIMTGLMVIFMFIAIAYILEIQKRQAERDELFQEFKLTKEELYQELDSIFKDDFAKWQVELDKDLSIKFTNPEVLFESGQARIRTRFKQILDSFFPKYLNILIQEKYRDRIAEIRIEGHTDPLPIQTKREEQEYFTDSLVSEEFLLDRSVKSNDPYIDNVELSQNRARSVLQYVRNQDAYRQLSDTLKLRLQFWLTANGLSYGRTLDDNKRLSFESGKAINNRNSRRVEFRIVTTSEKLVEKVLDEIK